MNGLPDELMINILCKYLDVRTLVEIKLVSRQWQHLSTTAIDSKGIGTTRKAFETNQELKEAVKRYCPVPDEERTQQQYCDREVAEDIACMYGWPINQWNVSQIKNLTGIFESKGIQFNIETEQLEYVDGIQFFNEDISDWNVSNAITMKKMFYNAKQFNQNLSTWNVSTVRNMEHMFMDASQFNQDISSWDVSNVTNMEMMFYGAHQFNQHLLTWKIWQRPCTTIHD